MPALILSGWHLLETAGKDTLNHMGTTGFAVLSGIAVLVALAVRDYRGGGRAALKKHWTPRLLWGFALTTCIWILLFIYCIVNAIYRDHVHWVAAAHAIGPYNTDLRIIRFERNAYEAGKPVLINVYYRYDGNNPARMRGYYKVVVVHLGEPDRNPEAIEALENQMWDQFIAQMDTPMHGLLIAPKSNGFVTLNGPVITAQQVGELNNAAAIEGLVLIVGKLMWIDGIGDYETDFCAFVRWNPEVFIDCNDHVGPVQYTGRPTVHRPPNEVTR
jgi:hypothetical protein